MLSALKTARCTQEQCGQKVGFLNAELVESAVTTRFCILFNSIRNHFPVLA